METNYKTDLACFSGGSVGLESRKRIKVTNLYKVGNTVCDFLISDLELEPGQHGAASQHCIEV